MLTWPWALVVAVLPSGKVALAPLVGAEKVTLTPETGLPYLSVTVATSGEPNALPVETDWPPPEVTAMLAGAAAVTVNGRLLLEGA
jgi:hypothetical protein